MKKLLGLLGAITIAGSALPTVMAVSPYPAEQKTKKHLKKIIETNNEIYSIAVDNRLGT
ncbi:hypothetical protein [Spiroplasma endosymbiont of Clivina fossor]|uniref:hypothetical protein n=1 Tax=Spiroplasma endosymbiont of Clivina fossor TaxID=3066282 RepID=UPI00313C0579